MTLRLKPARLKQWATVILALAATALPGLAASAPTSNTLEVEIRGAVLQPGVYSFKPGARLNDAAVASQVSSDAWFLGAALLKRNAIEAQTRLKAGILFELQTNQVHARAGNDDQLLALLTRLNTAVQAMPVTGRVQAEMDPLQQLFISNNDLLEHGDRLLYPSRATQVRVTGAVEQDCVLDHAAQMQLHDYRAACPQLGLADRDTSYLIQPDGNVSQHGAAYWNLEKANVAVGAVIYIPMKKRKLSPTTVGLNDDIAAMLATQYQLGGRFDE